MWIFLLCVDFIPRRRSKEIPTLHMWPFIILGLPTAVGICLIFETCLISFIYELDIIFQREARPACGILKVEKTQRDPGRGRISLSHSGLDGPTANFSLPPPRPKKSTIGGLVQTHANLLEPLSGRGVLCDVSPRLMQTNDVHEHGLRYSTRENCMSVYVGSKQKTLSATSFW